MKNRRRILERSAVGIAAALFACGGSSSGVSEEAWTPTCPAVMPCRDGHGVPNYTVPSYKTEIRPILEVACIPCHNSDGGIGGDPEDTYAEVSAQVESMLSQIGPLCNMPLSNGPQLSAPQRIALEEWLSCGGPNN
jgi:hypothetical protein